MLLALGVAAPAWAGEPLSWFQRGAAQVAPVTPSHPAVARIVAPERGAVSYGSGTLVDVRDQYGLVVTNWHVVRDATGTIEVVFPDGFRSLAQALKVDPHWDLAALVIWRPQVEPVPIAAVAPQPGDRLTIAGYGKGSYRAASGRCTQYVAPALNSPYEMVEVDVQAREGDSGGPIFNERGELAGVLFGAGGGTTSGSYAGRVRGFLATLAPDVGAMKQQIASAPPAVHAQAGEAGADTSTSGHAIDATLAEDDPENPFNNVEPDPPAQPHRLDGERTLLADAAENPPPRHATHDATELGDDSTSPALTAVPSGSQPETEPITWTDIAGETFYDQTKTVLAAIGALSVFWLVLRMTLS